MTMRQVPAREPIDRSKVVSVYSGRPGCCCGCRGKHSYSSAQREQGGRDRGYPVADAEVRDRIVSSVVSRLNGVIEAGNEAPEGAEAGLFVVEEAEGYARKFFSYQTDTRLYVVYYGKE